ncbi:MAG: late competence development ComFB family protein [Pseudanabaenaceae cyanobacterium bins.68]|nr:late competence development ComFB family protein [Pseudanabaenaceae cyanobacterium bins.68]
MQGCKNAIEDIVLGEATLQHSQLPIELQRQVQLNEVVCYALNRLPTMYATTQRGWSKLRDRARVELRDRIRQQVQAGIMAVQRDSIRAVNPLPQTQLDQAAIALFQLQELLRQPQLTWVEVPHAVYRAISSHKIKQSVQSNFDRQRSFLSHNNQSLKGSELKLPVPKHREFINVLEKLVISVAQSQMQRLEPQAAQRVNLYEVVAYALNHLKPMYATSEQGLQQQRQRAKIELSVEIIQTVRQAIVKMVNTPPRTVTPIPFIKMQENQEKALEELREILKVDHLDLTNLVGLVARAIAGESKAEI